MTRLINLSQQSPYNVNKKRTIRIMKKHGIKADYRQLTHKRIQAQQTYEAENILKRKFNQTAANLVLRRFIPKGQTIEELSDHQLV